MPCYTVQTVTMDLTASDPQLLAEALTAAGLSPDPGTTLGMADMVAEIIRTGKIRVPAGDVDHVARVKQLYAQKAVAQVAARYGWQMRQTGQRRLQLTRR